MIGFASPLPSANEPARSMQAAGNLDQGATPTVQGQPLNQAASLYGNAMQYSGHGRSEPPPKKARTLWDPIPVPWDESPTARCGRYSLAACIVLSMLVGAVVLLLNLAVTEAQCDDFIDDEESCEATHGCAWYGEGGRENLLGEKDSWTGQNCARWRG
eukprot:TRINITY_DN41516_c0_g1_i1.p1 TRINITY_DN41516_c0_g1~~TRINITY_DN41516_c0_g1_i1.p1  ORF type:complete len:158 (-),score=22.38 TRINITY_DN41516_c0_g1_i1:60-533(-)